MWDSETSHLYHFALENGEENKVWEVQNQFEKRSFALFEEDLK